MDQRIAVNPAVIDTVIAELRSDMRALCTMNDNQERFFDYMVGRATTAPSIPLVQQAQVADSLWNAIDGFPLARTFDPFRFPAIRIAQGVRRKRDRMIEQCGRPRSWRTS